MKYQPKIPIINLYFLNNSLTLTAQCEQGIIMRKNFILTALTFASLTFGITQAQAGAIESLKKFNSETTSITGTFNQVVKSKKKSITSSGSFEILRPGYFKWHYNKPYQQSIIGDGTTVWLYDKDLAQVTKKSQKSALGDSPAAFLSDKATLDSSYTLKEDGTENGVEYVLATPKSKNSGYQFIRIGFKGDALSAMQLKDSFGNQTSIKFGSINSSSNLKPANFKFTPPKGVDVLSQ